MPGRYAVYGAGWWRAHHFLALWRLQPHVIHRVVARIAGSGNVAAMGDGFLAWHVRRGDKARERSYTQGGPVGRGSVFRAVQYGPALARLLAEHAEDAKDVFLASDDPSALSDADALPSFAGGLVVRHSLQDSARLGSTDVSAADVGDADPEAAAVLALDSISNLAVLAESRYSLSLFHSNYARLATEFRHAKGLAGDAYAFLDERLCESKKHTHIDRDSYFHANATAWYLRLRRARQSLRLPMGFF